MASTAGRNAVRKRNSSAALLESVTPLLAPPSSLAQHCQRRWDTSPYRNVHKLTWTRLNRAKWPQNGSLVWAPNWGFQKPLPPPELLGFGPFTGGSSASTARARTTEFIGAASDTDASSSDERRPQLLHQLLQDRLGLTPQDALVLVQRSRVTVNDKIVRSNRWVEPHQEVSVNGHQLSDLEGIALLAHKPVGFALTEGDPLKRPTYASLLPDPSLIVRPVGAVDLGSSGLLVLTNNNRLKNALQPVPRKGNGGHSSAQSALERRPLLATFLVQLRYPLRPSQMAVLETSAPYGKDSWPPELVEEIEFDPYSDDEGERVADTSQRQLPEGLSPRPDEVSAILGGSPWSRWELLEVQKERQTETEEEPPMLRVSLPGGTAAQIRNALGFVGAPPAASICCVSLGPLTIQSSDLQNPGDVRPLSSEEVSAVLASTSESHP